MMSKRLIANCVKTEHYLVIDDDIVAIRKFGMKDIFANKIRKQVRYTPDKVFNENWWTSSAHVLNMPNDECDTADFTDKRSETPNELFRRTVR